VEKDLVEDVEVQGEESVKEANQEMAE